MGKDWETLAGEQGKKVDGSRWGRALKLGKLATQFTGSMIKAQFGKKEAEDSEALAIAALKNARHIVDVMGELKGAAMKIGQMLSADPDLVAPEFADQLARLQRDAPPMDFVTVQAQIERALDRPLPDVFRYFDPAPLGSASIGQVHRATLFDGREVAVKVQYPGIVASLDSDLKNLKSLLVLGRVFMTRERADEFITEARAAILGEADYQAEGENLARFGELLAGREGIRVPKPVLEWTRGTVLVMEFIRGVKFDDGLGAIADRHERARLIERFVATYIHMFHDLHLLHADPHPGNFLLTPEHDIAFLDFGCVRPFRSELTDGVLRMLVAFWRDDWGSLSGLLTEFGFGKPGMQLPSHEVLRAYHRIILEPVAKDETFNFSTWQVHSRTRAFLKNNLEFLKLVPPAELLLYFRVLAGVKGLLTRVDADVNIRRLAEGVCRQHGFEP